MFALNVKHTHILCPNWFDARVNIHIKWKVISRWCQFENIRIKVYLHENANIINVSISNRYYSCFMQNADVEHEAQLK